MDEDLELEAARKRKRTSQLLAVASILLIVLRIAAFVEKHTAHKPREVVQYVVPDPCNILHDIVNAKRYNFNLIKSKNPFSTDSNHKYYHSLINIGRDSGEIIFSIRTNKWIYRGFFSYKPSDTSFATDYFDKKFESIASCFPDWAYKKAIDTITQVPFTRFTKDKTQMELFLIKRPNKQNSLVGLVIEDAK